MGKVLERAVEKQEVIRMVDPSLKAIEKLTILNGSLVEQVKALSIEVDSLKGKMAQVASRLGL